MALTDLQSKIIAWIEQQLGEGRPLQAIADELTAKSEAELSHREKFVEQLQAHVRGKGPPPTRDRSAEAYAWGAYRLSMVMVERNLKGRELEKAGRLDEAIALYERNVADGVQASHPYDRLRIIYTRQKRYEEAIRVCQAYLGLPDREHGQNKDHFRHHLGRLQAKAARQRG